MFKVLWSSIKESFKLFLYRLSLFAVSIIVTIVGLFVAWIVAIIMLFATEDKYYELYEMIWNTGVAVNENLKLNIWKN